MQILPVMFTSPKIRVLVVAAIVLATFCPAVVEAQRRGDGSSRSGGSGRRGNAESDTAAGTASDAAAPVVQGADTVPTLWQLQRPPDIDLSPTLGTALPPVPAKVVRYAESVLQRYDANGDGLLQHEEWARLPGAPQAMDVDGDGVLTLEELVRYAAHFGQGRTIHRPQPRAMVSLTSAPVQERPKLFQPISPSTRSGAATDDQAASTDDVRGGDIVEAMLHTESDLSPEAILAAEQQIPAARRYHTPNEELEGVPAWFRLRDFNGDGQISIIEFAPNLSSAALALFGRFDLNGDGVIVPSEAKTKL